MGKDNIVTLKKPGVAENLLMEVLMNGAKKLLVAAIEAEEFLVNQRDQQLESGKARFVRNGYLPEREIQTGISDGTLEFWGALNEVYGETQHQRCWFHKMSNVLDKLPKTQHANATKHLQAIWMAATRLEAYKAFDCFVKPMKPRTQKPRPV